MAVGLKMAEECQDCGRWFKDATSLAQHTWDKHRSKHWTQCSLCATWVEAGNGLKQHLRDKHGVLTAMGLRHGVVQRFGVKEKGHCEDEVSG